MLERIIELCKQKGMTIAELERKSGLQPRTVYKWNRSTPSVDKVLAVANALGTTVEDLSKGGE